MIDRFKRIKKNPLLSFRKKINNILLVFFKAIDNAKLMIQIVRALLQ
jgi:hypothetical protein